MAQNCSPSAAWGSPHWHLTHSRPGWIRARRMSPGPGGRWGSILFPKHLPLLRVPSSLYQLGWAFGVSPHCTPLPFTEEKIGPLRMAGPRGMAEHWEPRLQASVWFGSCSTLPQPHPSQPLPGQQEGAPLSTQIHRGPEGRAGDSHTAQPQQAGSGAPVLAPTCAPASLPTCTRGAWPLSVAS